MYRNQLIGRVALLRRVTSNNEELVFGSIFVAAVRILPCSEIAVSHINRLWTLVAIVPAILTNNRGQLTGSSHVLEGVMQKAVLRLTVPSIIINNKHCLVTLERVWLYMLNFKPVSLRKILRQSPKWAHWSPQSQQQ